MAPCAMQYRCRRNAAARCSKASNAATWIRPCWNRPRAIISACASTRSRRAVPARCGWRSTRPCGTTPTTGGLRCRRSCWPRRRASHCAWADADRRGSTARSRASISPAPAMPAAPRCRAARWIRHRRRPCISRPGRPNRAAIPACTTMPITRSPKCRWPWFRSRARSRMRSACCGMRPPPAASATTRASSPCSTAISARWAMAVCACACCATRARTAASSRCATATGRHCARRFRRWSTTAPPTCPTGHHRPASANTCWSAMACRTMAMARCRRWLRGSACMRWPRPRPIPRGWRRLPKPAAVGWWPGRAVTDWRAPRAPCCRTARMSSRCRARAWTTWWRNRAGSTMASCGSPAACARRPACCASSWRTARGSVASKCRCPPVPRSACRCRRPGLHGRCRRCRPNRSAIVRRSPASATPSAW